MGETIKITTISECKKGKRKVVREQLIQTEEANKALFNCNQEGLPVNKPILDKLGIKYECGA